MITDVRLHVWIVTTDDEGNFVRNAQDTKHVAVYTKEFEWAVPTLQEKELSMSPASLKEYMLSSPFIEDELQNVDVSIIKQDDTESIVSILKRFPWTYTKDNPVSFSLFIEPGSTKFGAERYKIDDTIIDMLLKTFTGVHLSMGGNTVRIPNVTYPNDLKSLTIENAIVECQNMIASFDSFDLINCELRHAIEGSPTFFNITVHEHIGLSRIKLIHPVYFQIMAKNENVTKWQTINASVQFVEVLFSYEPLVIDYVFKFMNFASISFFEIIIKSNNANITCVNIIDCISARIHNIQSFSSIRRKAHDIICKGCTNVSIADSQFKTILPNKATITEGKAAILFNKMENASINLSKIDVQNARLFMGVSSIIDKIILDTITSTEDAKSIVIHTSTIKELFIVNTSLPRFEMFNSFDVNKIKIKDSDIRCKGDVTLHNVESLRIENSSLVQSAILRVELAKNGKCDIDSSVCKTNNFQIVHPYTTDELDKIRVGSGESVYNENKSTLSIVNLSSIEGSIETKDIGKITLSRCKLKVKSAKLHGIQGGESHFDLDSSYISSGFDVEFTTLRNFNITCIRSVKPLNIRCNNTKGNLKLKFRDPNSTSATQKQNIGIELNTSNIRLQFENEALASTASILFKSKNSQGTDISWSEENQSVEAIQMQIDPTSYDFNIMRRRTSAYDSSNIVYG